ncbi:MAG: hypothetical protein V9F04_16890 [Dermatophilaceae bacterium]
MYALGLMLQPAVEAAAAWRPRGGAKPRRPHWSVQTSLIVLALATLAVVWLSEILVGDGGAGDGRSSG